jgi:hypothetical protein
MVSLERVLSYHGMLCTRAGVTWNALPPPAAPLKTPSSDQESLRPPRLCGEMPVLRRLPRNGHHPRNVDNVDKLDNVDNLGNPDSPPDSCTSPRLQVDSGRKMR